jgi:hypothetical protein
MDFPVGEAGSRRGKNKKATKNDKNLPKRKSKIKF